MAVVSIMYHDVVEKGQSGASGFPGRDADLYKLERPQFLEHLRAIEQSVSQPPACPHELADNPSSSPWVITFDDGGASAYSQVVDILDERKWHGHFLVTTDYIGHPSFVTPMEIQELHARGHCIGSHSASHPDRMSNCSWHQMITEWKASTSVLSEILGETTRLASVPGGHYSRKIAEAATLSGIEVLFTSEPTTSLSRVNGCLVLGRYAVQRGTSPEKVAGLVAGRGHERSRQAVLWKAKKVAKAVGGENYLKVRQLLLRLGPQR